MSAASRLILPFRRPALGAVELPGSKSISNRALILAALAEGTTTLAGVLFSRDTELMIAALRKLGLALEVDEAARVVRVEGGGGTWPRHEARLHIGNAGTAARFLTALLSLDPAGRYHLDGDPPMRQRPMAALLEALARQGTEMAFDDEPGHFPFSLHTRGLRGGPVSIDATASSQFVSALLMVAPLAARDLVLDVAHLRPAFVQITTTLMRQFGVETPAVEKGRLTIASGQRYRSPGIYAVEPDVSAASYFLALPLVVGGAIVLPGLTPQLMQGDAAFGAIVEALGGQLRKDAHGWEISAEPALRPGLDRDFNAFSDTFLTLAALAPLLDGPTRIRGIGHTRRQETDRIAAMARELRKLGCRVEEAEDALEIHPDPAALRRAARAGVAIETYEDHRIAMSFAILGCASLRPDGSPWLTILDPDCTRKTFPEFFPRLAAIHAASHI